MAIVLWCIRKDSANFREKIFIFKVSAIFWKGKLCRAKSLHPNVQVAYVAKFLFKKNHREQRNEYYLKICKFLPFLAKNKLFLIIFVMPSKWENYFFFCRVQWKNNLVFKTKQNTGSTFFSTSFLCSWFYVTVWTCVGPLTR